MKANENCEKIAKLAHSLFGKKSCATPEYVAAQIKLIKEQPWDETMLSKCHGKFFGWHLVNERGVVLH